MQVICWNIRKNNAKNIQVELIAAAVAKSADPRAPWLLAILENTKDGDTVGERLRTALGGQWHHVIAAGGGAHTRENVVLIGGGGCAFKIAVADTSWQAMFGGRYNLDYFSNVVHAESHASQSSTRASTTTARVTSARKERPWDPGNCRNPILVKVGANGRDYSFGFVHSPGPAEGVTYSAATYAETYFSCIMESLQSLGLDGLLGDFNMYGSEPRPDGGGTLTDVSINLGGTTFKKATDTVGDSRLDRAYLSSRFALHSAVSLVNGSSLASDHVGVYIRLQTCGECLHTLLAAIEALISTSSSSSSSSSSSTPPPPTPHLLRPAHEESKEQMDTTGD